MHRTTGLMHKIYYTRFPVISRRRGSCQLVDNKSL